MDYETSERGFKHYVPTSTAYGHEVSVYESSAASAPHLWLKIEQTPETAQRFGMKPEEATAHLSVEQAIEVIAKLSAALAQHYQRS